uniref:Uncharacterized protein n=1 Tax=viral metagenome TaxID=1070528 RepID=A0A6C0AMP0_9ZZZZ
MSEITINPLKGLVTASPRRKKVPRPKWMCKHPNAALINRDNCIYRCIECNPTNGTITVIPGVGTKAKQSPKRVTVSPCISADSPRGFS